MLPLQIFFASAGIALTAYVGYVIIKSWINRWKRHNVSESLTSKETLIQPPSASIPSDPSKNLGPAVAHFSQNDLKKSNPLTANTDPESDNKAKEAQKQKGNPVDEFNKRHQKMDQDIAEIKASYQDLHTRLDASEAKYESNLRLLDEVKAKITEANSSPSP